MSPKRIGIALEAEAPESVDLTMGTKARDLRHGDFHGSVQIVGAVGAQSSINKLTTSP